MIELRNNQLLVSFSELHPKAHCGIELQRTLRIPDDNREHYLPPGLGRYPLAHVDDFGEKLPISWAKRGGVFLPMYQAEAMWLNFNCEYPCAIKVAAGKINAVTGEGWKNAISSTPQDYIVIPDQPWLDGFCVSKGHIRQFVAMSLGDGYTAEEQLTGAAEHGGIQILVVPMKRERYERIRKEGSRFRTGHYDEIAHGVECRSVDMGLAPGGLMRQHIFEDRYGIDAWDTSAVARCFVHILNSTQFLAVTGNPPPNKPPTAVDYTKAGLPWFDYYSGDLSALVGAKALAGLDSVAAKAINQGDFPLPDNAPVISASVEVLKSKKSTLRDGRW